MGTGEYSGMVEYVVGQTWNEFCNSSYNDSYGFYFSSNSLYSKNGYIVYGVSGTSYFNINEDTLVSAYTRYTYDF